MSQFRVALASSAIVNMSYRGVQPVSHVLQIPPQGGARDLQGIHQLWEGDQFAIRDHLVDFVEAFGLVHLSPGFFEPLYHPMRL